MATVKKIYKKLGKMIREGYGDHKFGYFEHHRGSFIEFSDVRASTNGGYYEQPGTEKTEEVVHAYPLLEEDD